MSAERIGSETRRAFREARPWLVLFGRFGYAAKGLVYVLIGGLALQAAVGAGGQTTDSQGALRQIAQAPFGDVLLFVTGVGLVGYALWRVIQAVMDTDNKGSNLRGISTRTGYFFVGLIHAALATFAFALVSGHDSAQGDSPQAWTARLMSAPYGEWLVGIVGAAFIGYGISQLYLAFSPKIREKLKLNEMSATEIAWTTGFARLGYAARAIVFGIIGVFLVVAAIYEDPNEARGLDGALQTLVEQPWGDAVLGTVAFGLTAFGIFMFVEARYRRMVATGSMPH